jgi:hypothetical protein
LPGRLCSVGPRIVEHIQIGSKISGNQIARTSAAANIDLGRSGTDQITIAIECVQEPRLIGAGIGLNSPQRIFLYEK